LFPASRVLIWIRVLNEKSICRSPREAARRPARWFLAPSMTRFDVYASPAGRIRCRKDSTFDPCLEVSEDYCLDTNLRTYGTQITAESHIPNTLPHPRRTRTSWRRSRDSYVMKLGLGGASKIFFCKENRVWRPTQIHFRRMTGSHYEVSWVMSPIKQSTVFASH